MVLEGGDEGGRGGVFDCFDDDALGHIGGAVGAGEGCDVVFACGKERLDDEFAAGTGGLVGLVLMGCGGVVKGPTPTMAMFLR